MIKTELRRGAYYDSIVLMELQAALAALPGVEAAGAMMGTEANKALLDEQGLLTPKAEAARADDLIIALRAEDEAALDAALGQVDTLLTRRRAHAHDQEYRPKSLETAVQMRPEATWVLVSVPGRYAAAVAREALRLGKHVFLYSDNVSLEDEVSLKQEAAENGLLVMGPDCGTAILGGVGLGFANRVRRGPIGLVAASGTGVQHVAARIHHLGSGLTHALGTGGRDLSAEVGGRTAQQAFDLLRRDPETRVIVVLSKPPDPSVAAALVAQGRQAGKPVVFYFTGYIPPGWAAAPMRYVAGSLDQAADMAVTLANDPPLEVPPGSTETRYLRGLFSGGTLAYEMLRLLHAYLPGVYSNAPLRPQYALSDPRVSQAHTLLDLGADAFTVGRPHPMLDHTLRLERLAQEAADPEVGLLLLDVVLGHGAHPDPAALLAPALTEAREAAQRAGHVLDVVVLLVGTEEDPQDFSMQKERLEAAGAQVFTRCADAANHIGERLAVPVGETAWLPPVDLAVLRTPLSAINVGLEAFAASLQAQEAPVLHIDWRPPAGGDDRLLSILERMKNR